MKQLLPALASLALLMGGPHRERLAMVHAPRVLLFMLLAALVLLRGHPKRLGVLEWLGLTSGVALFASAALSHAWAMAFEPMLPWLAFVGLLLGAGHLQSERPRWLAFCAVAVTVLALLGLLESLGVGPPSLRGRAPSATLGQRNALAHVLALGSPLLWWLGLRAHSRRTSVAAAVAAGAVACTVVVTRCRAAWLVLAVTLLAFLAMSRSRRGLGVAAGVLAGAAAGIWTPWRLSWEQPHPYRDTLGRLFEWDAGSGAFRLLEWSQSLELWKRSPVFGVGPGHWYLDYGASLGSSHFAHSDWVGMLVERGVVGVALVAALGVFALRAFWRTPERTLVTCTLLACTALMALDAVVQLPAALVLLGVVVFVGHRPDQPTENRWAAAPWAALSLPAGAVVASLLLSTSPAAGFDEVELAARLNPFDAEARAALVQGWASADECPKAAPHAAALRRLMPHHPMVASFERTCGAER